MRRAGDLAALGGTLPELWRVEHVRARAGAPRARSASGVARAPALPLADVLDGRAARRCRPASASSTASWAAAWSAGSVTLLFGPPGIGKSTLLFQVLSSVAATGLDVMLASAEESLAQVRGRASRIGLVPRHLLALEGPDVEAIEAAVERHRPALVVVDSLQSVSDPELGQPAGSLAQVRTCVERLTRMAKSSGAPLLLVGHVTKDGDLAGPRAVEHLVDTVLSFDGDRHHALRVLTSVKHRFGPAGEVGIFEMRDDGLRAVPDPGPLMLGDRMAGVPGSVVVPVLQGRRPLLVEVQALLGPGAGGGTGPPRPQTLGIDAARANLLVAVLACRTAVDIPASAQMFAAAVGGITVTEPAADLAVALAMASVITDRALPPDVVVFGELGLAGEVRTVPGADRRLAEAHRAGFTRALVPASTVTERAPRRRHGGARCAHAGRGADAHPVRGRRAGRAGYDARVADGPGGSQPLNDALAMIAPGTRLREGLDRILQAKHGALILVGDDPAVLSVCTGGFLLDAEYTPQRLSELAKMDGAIILATDASRIARANVHLVPKATIATSETGTRHRTAERVARSIDVPVIAVSEAMATIAVYRNDHKHTTQSAGWLIDRSSQALSTLQRFRARYDDALSTLTRLEMEDTVSVRDVVSVLQPGEMVRRIAEEIEGHLVELGSDGRLIHLQTEELSAGVCESLTLVLRDYADDAGSPTCARCPADALMDLPKVVAALNLPASDDQLHAELAPHGYRLLHRLPQPLSETLTSAWCSASARCPRSSPPRPPSSSRSTGIGAATARHVRDGLARLVEASIFERYE